VGAENSSTKLFTTGTGALYLVTDEALGFHIAGWSVWEGQLDHQHPEAALDVYGLKPTRHPRHIIAAISVLSLSAVHPAGGCASRVQATCTRACNVS
jgi:hypothetical protein